MVGQCEENNINNVDNEEKRQYTILITFTIQQFRNQRIYIPYGQYR